MYIYEKRALKRCHHVILRDLNPNVPFLVKLEKEQVIDSDQRCEITEKPSRNDKVTTLLNILSEQEDGTCIRLINVLKSEYPWISIHLHREFIKEKTSFNKEFNQELSDVVNDQISPMVLGPGAEECKSPTSSKDSLACVETISDLLQKLQTLSYRPLNVDPLQICNMALCVVLEDKIRKYKRTIDNLQEKITKLKVPHNNIRILKQEIINQKETAKHLEKQNKIKESAVSHLEHQNALLKQKLEALQKSTVNICPVCNTHCSRVHPSYK